MIFLNFVVIIISVIQVHQMARVFPTINDMIKLLQKVITSVIGFTFYFLCWVYLFGIAYNLMGITFDNKDYTDLDPFIVIFITSFRMSLADINVPDYSLWSD